VIVKGHVLDAAGAGVPRVTVTATVLVEAGETGWASTLYGEITRPRYARTADGTGAQAAGYWEMDLVPSSQIDGNPRHRIIYRGASHDVTVPASGGPYWLGDLLGGSTPSGPPYPSPTLYPSTTLYPGAAA
jgi:hypothetical protein